MLLRWATTSGEGLLKRRKDLNEEAFFVRRKLAITDEPIIELRCAKISRFLVEKHEVDAFAVYYMCECLSHRFQWRSSFVGGCSTRTCVDTFSDEKVCGSQGSFGTSCCHGGEGWCCEYFGFVVAATIEEARWETVAARFVHMDSVYRHIDKRAFVPADILH